MHSQRALTRRGAVHLHLRSYRSAKLDLAKAWELSSENEKAKLAPMMKQVQNGLKRETEASEKRKEALKKAFDEGKIRSSTDVEPEIPRVERSRIGNDYKKSNEEGSTLFQRILILFSHFAGVIIGIVVVFYRAIVARLDFRKKD